MAPRRSSGPIRSTWRITILVEGNTEMAFKSHLTAFLRTRLEGSMPRLDLFPCNGRIPKKDDLRRNSRSFLDVWLRRGHGTFPRVHGTPDFRDAIDAKQKMRQWVGPNPQFYPHAAQYEFEA